MTNAINLPPVARAVSGTGLTVRPVWQINQVLQGLVVGRASDQLFILRIGTTEVSARSDLPLTVGARLTLRVTNLQPEPVLKVIASDNAMSQTAGTDPAAVATRQLLPRQTAMPPLFALLKAVTLPGGGKHLPTPLKGVMHAILERTPASELTAPGIKRAISDSGLFLEAKLLQASTSGQAVPEFDLKRLLLTLLHRLPERTGSSGQRSQDTTPQVTPQNSNRQPIIPGPADATASAAPKTAPEHAGARSVPPQDTQPGRTTTPQPQAREPLPDLSTIEADALTHKLRQQTEGALARLTLHQVHTAKHAAEGDLNWAMEIPLLHKGQIDIVSLTVERRSRSNKNEAEPSWLVKLALDMPQCGSLHATVLWHKEQVSSVLWAERDSTADLVRHHLDHLHAALAGQGLAVTTLECRTGKPPDATRHSVPQCRVYGKA
jgi:hypothetical protein